MVTNIKPYPLGVHFVTQAKEIGRLLANRMASAFNRAIDLIKDVYYQVTMCLQHWGITRKVTSGCLGIANLVARIFRIYQSAVIQFVSEEEEFREIHRLVVDLMRSYRGKALVKAASNGDLARVEELLANGAGVPEFDRGEALKNAVSRGHLEIVRALLANGAVVSKLDRGDALKMAVSNGHLEIVQALLANGAVVSKLDRGDALKKAVSKGHLEIVRALLANGGVVSKFARGDALKKAASKGHLEIVRALLANGAVIPELDKGRAQRAAAVNGHTAIVDFFQGI